MAIDNSTREQIKALLLHNKIATIATIGVESHTPQAAIVYFLYDDSDGIYIATLPESRKLLNLTANPTVSLALGEESKKQTAQIEGIAEVITDSEMQVKVLLDLNRKISEHSQNAWPLLKLEPKDIVVLRIQIHWLRFSSFGEDRQIVEIKGSDLKEHLGL